MDKYRCEICVELKTNTNKNCICAVTNRPIPNVSSTPTWCPLKDMRENKMYINDIVNEIKIRSE